jgi:uncharacterized protein YdhG (YjbR/CyaY superfamily)
MAEGTKKTARSRTEPSEGGGFTEDEKAAMRERAREMKAEAKRGSGGKGDGLADLQAKIAELDGPERAIAQRVHEIVMAAAPELEPKTWYGMPAWARKGKVVCFFQPGSKFKARYATLGFQDEARLDEGTMWPTSWALTDLTPADEQLIATLVTRATT